MRHLITALDIAGAGLAASGLCLLAYIVHPYLALLTAGVCCLIGAFLLERPKRGSE